MTTTESQTGTLTQIPADSIQPGNNDRTIFDTEELEELAASIREHGLAQPPTVRPLGDVYEMVAGERRFRAMTTVLGWSDIPVFLRADLTDAAASALMLAENVQRQDLDPIDEAAAYAKRMDEFGLTVGEVAHMANVSIARVTTRLPLLDLCAEAAKLVRDKALSINHARVLAPLDSNRQVLAIRTLGTKGLDYFAFRDLCGRLHDEQVTESMFDTDDFLRVQDLADDAAANRRKGRRTQVEMIRALCEALEATGSNTELVAEARAIVNK